MTTNLIQQRITDDGKVIVVWLDKSSAALVIEDDSMALLSAKGPVAYTNVRCYSTPFYKNFVQFCRNAGPRLRVGMFTANGMRIMTVYDSREQFYPTIDDVLPEQRDLIRVEMEEGAQLSENGRLTEWPQGGNFGWFWNMDEPDFCEWGYASMYPIADETFDQMYFRQKENYDALVEALGGPDNIAVIDAGQQIKLVKGSDQ